MRFLLKSLAWLLLTAILVLPPWVLYSESGTRALVSTALSFFAEQAKVEQIEGRLSESVVISVARLDISGWRIEVERLTVGVYLPALVQRKLIFHTLDVQGVRAVPNGTAPEPAPARNVVDGSPLQLPVAIATPAAHLMGICIADAECIEQARVTALLERNADLVVWASADSPSASLKVAGSAALAELDHIDLRGNGRLAVNGEELMLQSAISGGRDQIILKGQSGGALSAQFDGSVNDPFGELSWQLGVRRTGTVAGLLPSPALDGPAMLEVSGDGTSLGGEGRFTLNGEPVHLSDLDLTWPDFPSLSIHSATLIQDATESRLELNGDFSLQPLRADLTLSGSSAPLLQFDDGAPVQVRYRGQGDLSGDLDNWTLIAGANVQGIVEEGVESDSEGQERAEPEPISGEIQLRATGDANGAVLERLNVITGSGTLAGQGDVVWTPAPSLSLSLSAQAFNPGYWLPGWSGSLSFESQVRVQSVDDTWHGTLALQSLAGDLRGYPVSGEVQIERSQQLTTANGRFESADAQVAFDGRMDDALSADITIQAADLSQLWPEAAGQLAGQVKLGGTVQLPQLSGDLVGEQLRLGELALDRLEIDGGGDLDDWRSQLELTHLTLDSSADNPWRFERVVLNGEGRGSQVTLKADAVLPWFEVSTQAQGELENNALTGNVSETRIESAEAGTWRQVGSAPLRVTGAELQSLRLILEGYCLEKNGARACLESQAQVASGPSRVAVEFDARDVPVQDVLALMPQSDNELRSVEGSFATQGQWRWGDLGHSVTADLSAPRWTWRWQDESIAQQTNVTNLEASLKLDDEHLYANAKAEIDGGSLKARLAYPLSDDAQSLDGEITLADLSVTHLSLLWPQIDEVGEVNASMSISGSRVQPRFSGQARATNLVLQFPAQGIAPTLSEITVDGDGDHLNLAFRATSGEGQLSGEGELALLDSGLDGQIKIQGESFEVMRTVAAQLSASPDVIATITPDHIHVEGDVTLPGGQVDLSRLSTGVAPSTDVVLPEGVGPGEDPWPWETSARIGLVIDPPLKLTASGFEGDVSGELRLIDGLAEEPVGRGRLTLTGTYRAYGQDLTLEQGLLVFQGSPLSNPNLDIKAVRETNGVKSGLLVTGTLRSPHGELWSDPPMGDAEALAYILTGRPLSEVQPGTDEGLSNAAQALALSGGNALSAPVARSLGVDDLRLESTAGLEQATLLVGKYLSPDLYIAYGVGLTEPVNVVRLSYRINERWRIEAESGNESKAAIRYRIEKN